MAESDKGFEFPEGMDPAKYLDQFKEITNDGLKTTLKAYEQAQKAMEEAQKEAESGMNTAQQHASKISMATLQSVKDNAEKTLTHMQNLAGVQSMSELLQLQSAFVREQAEMATETAKSMQALYEEAASDAVAPAKKAAEKAMDALKGK